MFLLKRLVIAMFLVLPCSNLALSEDNSSEAARSMQRQQELMETVIDYVVRTKGWPRGSFTVTVEVSHLRKVEFRVSKKEVKLIDPNRPWIVDREEADFAVIIDTESNKVLGRGTYQ